MLRVLSILAVVCVSLTGARDGEARMIIERPSVARSCPGAATWGATLKCLERFGTPKLLRSEGKARLVQISPNEHGFRTAGVYLYLQGKKRWQIGGMHLDDKPTLIGFSTPTYDHHKMFRIDFVNAENQEILVGEVSTRNAFVRRKTAVFCSGESPVCTQVLTTCDVFVGGKLHATFRATLKFENGVLQVLGDRTQAGDQCAQSEETVLPVPIDLRDFE